MYRPKVSLVDPTGGSEPPTRGVDMPRPPQYSHHHNHVNHEAPPKTEEQRRREKAAWKDEKRRARERERELQMQQGGASIGPKYQEMKEEQNPNYSLTNRKCWAQREFKYFGILNPRDESVTFSCAVSFADIFKYRKDGTEIGSERQGDPRKAAIIQSSLVSYVNPSPFDLLLQCNATHVRGNVYDTYTGKRGLGILLREHTHVYPNEHARKLSHSDERAIQLFLTQRYANLDEADLRDIQQITQPTDGRSGFLIPKRGMLGEVIIHNHKKRAITIEREYNSKTIVHEMGDCFWVVHDAYIALSKHMQTRCLDRMPYVDILHLTLTAVAAGPPMSNPIWIGAAARMGGPEVVNALLTSEYGITASIIFCYALFGNFTPGYTEPSSSSPSSSSAY